MPFKHEASQIQYGSAQVRKAKGKNILMMNKWHTKLISVMAAADFSKSRPAGCFMAALPQEP